MNVILGKIGTQASPNEVELSKLHKKYR